MGDDLGRDPSWVLTQREGDFEPPVTTPRIYHLKCELEALFSCFLTTMGHLATYVVHRGPLAEQFHTYHAYTAK